MGVGQRSMSAWNPLGLKSTLGVVCQHHRDLALLGTQSILCGQVGEDEFGKNYAQQMTDTCGNNGLRLSPMEIPENALSSARKTQSARLSPIWPQTSRAWVTLGVDSEQPTAPCHRILVSGGPMAKTAWEAMDVAKEAGVPISVDAPTLSSTR